ncbi:hypothetical protein [Viridibacillus arvi]|uniref:hypothetical protein n=1 Tax=Viridibacillus arvi TaxID=263475 RepID=UPI0034CED748
MKYIVEITDQIQNFNEYITVTKKNGELIDGTYKMTLQEFLNSLNEAIDLGDEMLETPILPNNCIKFVWKNINLNVAEVYIVVPKMRRDITFYQNPMKQVGFPKMIFKYTIENQKVSLSTIVALRNDGPIHLDTPLYHFPFSHVSSEGDVCMGGNTFPNIQRIQQIESFHNLFLSSPFSSDYGAKTTTGKTINQLFDELANQDLDDDLLLPITKMVAEPETKSLIKKQTTLGEYFKFETI